VISVKPIKIKFHVTKEKIPNISTNSMNDVNETPKTYAPKCT